MYFKHYWEGQLKHWGGRVMRSNILLNKIRKTLKPRLVSYNAVTHRSPTENTWVSLYQDQIRLKGVSDQKQYKTASR